jgi:streptogramin lyase
LLLLFFPLLVSATAPAVKITEYTVTTAGSVPYTIAAGKDGLLYFTENAAKKIGIMTTAGVMLPEYVTASTGPLGIASVAQGTTLDPNATTLLFAESSGAVGIAIYFDDTSSALVNDFQTGFSTPSQLVFGPDGRVWITELGNASLYALHWLDNSPSSVEYPLPGGSQPDGIAAAIDGNALWVADKGNARIFFCSTGGTCTPYSTPTLASQPRRLVQDRWGDVWVTENAVNRIGRFKPFTGWVTEYTLAGGSAPLGITLGPDGNVWFTENGAGKIGRITHAGVVTEYPLPSGGGPTSICLGPDGNLYVTENSAAKIAKVEVFVPGDVDASGDVNVSDVFYLINYLFAGGPPPK